MEGKNGNRFNVSVPRGVCFWMFKIINRCADNRRSNHGRGHDDVEFCRSHGGVSKVIHKLTKDEVGNRYGMLVVERPYRADGKGAIWVCRCDCGIEIAVRGTKLRYGNTRSCGCLRRMPFKERKKRGFMD